MPYRTTPFVSDYFYHIFNRGVEKRQIFLDDADYQRFIQTLYYYQFSGPKPRFSTHKRFRKQDFNKNPRIVEIICYCLMPNHFHLLLKQLAEKGIQEFLCKVSNSYTKYFNTKHHRIGPLFQGQFKAVFVETDEQLVHVSSYIHLNPFVAEITRNWINYPYSSAKEFVEENRSGFCNPKEILNLANGSKKYAQFVKDQQSYSLELARIKHLLLDED